MVRPKYMIASWRKSKDSFVKQLLKYWITFHQEEEDEIKSKLKSLTCENIDMETAKHAKRKSAMRENAHDSDFYFGLILFTIKFPLDFTSFILLFGEFDQANLELFYLAPSLDLISSRYSYI